MQSRSNCYEQTCPHCGSGEVHRTVWNGLVERCVLYFWGMFPFRCRSCSERFYRRIISRARANPRSMGINSVARPKSN